MNRTRNLKKKKLKDEYYKIIRNDICLREIIAKSLNIESQSVYTAAIRKTFRFSEPAILKIIANHLNVSKEEILQ